MDRGELLTSIVKGAEYIEKVGPKHPTYEVARNKYDRLVLELYQLDGRDANGLSELASLNPRHE